MKQTPKQIVLAKYPFAWCDFCYFHDKVGKYIILQPFRCGDRTLCDWQTTAAGAWRTVAKQIQEGK